MAVIYSMTAEVVFAMPELHKQDKKHDGFDYIHSTKFTSHIHIQTRTAGYSGTKVIIIRGFLFNCLVTKL